MAMNIELERKEIIKEIKHINDEWLIKGIKRLLGMDYADEITEEQKEILDERIAEYESGQAETMSLEEVKKSLYNKK